MQKEINFYQEMASEHRFQENGTSSVPLCVGHLACLENVATVKLVYLLKQLWHDAACLQGNITLDIFSS